MVKKSYRGIPRSRISLVVVLSVLLLIAVIVAATSKREHAQTAGSQQNNDSVVVSEVMTGNTGLVSDDRGEHPDYIELHNRSSQPVDISGWTISDREDRAWIFPGGTVLAPGEYKILWCTGENTDSDSIANFKLSAGEVLRFTDGFGSMLLNMELGELFPGMVWAYDMAGNWSQTAPSPGYSNSPEGIAAFEQSKLLGELPNSSAIGITSTHNGVYISEFMPGNKLTTAGPDGSYPDWVELYNSTNNTVDLSGCGLSDDAAKPYKFTFPQGSSIQPGEYMLLWCTSEPIEGYYCLNFGLSSQGETLTLSDSHGGILDIVKWDSAIKDYAYVRSYNQMGDFDPHSPFSQTDRPSPGYPNTVAGFEAFDRNRNPDIGVHDIIINEVLSDGYRWYMKDGTTPWDDDQGRWVELYNKGDRDITLTGYSISDNGNQPDKWVFPEGTSIAAKGYLILYMNGSLPLEGKDEKSVTEEMKRMTLSFTVAGTGESLYLFDAGQTLIDRVTVPKSVACLSYARKSDGSWGFCESPTQGAENRQVLNCSNYAPTPVFSLDSGLYHGKQSVTIEVPEGCYVSYTTDCTVPTEQSLLYQPGQSIALEGNTVIRARSFSKDGGLYKSDIASQTYVIIGSEQTQEAHDTNLNVVFLVTDPANLFDLDYGIHVLGNAYKGPEDPASWEEGSTHYMGANFNQSGREWERECHMTYTAKGGGSVEYKQDLLIRIFGAFSRRDKMKGFGLIARKGFGGSTIQYPFFENRPFTEYESLVLRASAKDWNMSRMRDIVVNGLLDDAKVDISTQAYVQTVVYLNGQYWGVYNLREKVSRGFFAQHYGVSDKDSIDVLVGNGDYVSGDKQAVKDYEALINYCKEHNCDLSSASAYKYVCDRVDIQNFADYIAMEILVGNTDTGNIKFWRSSQLDNRWRWVPYDFDWAMNRNDDNSLETTTGYRRNFFYKYLREEGHGAGRNFSTVLSRSLLSNNEFVEIFLRSCAKMFNDVYSTEKIKAKVAELQDNIAAEMEWDFPRWGLKVKNWKSHVNNIIAYAENYPSYYVKYCKEYINKYTNYRLTDDKLIELFSRAG